MTLDLETMERLAWARNDQRTLAIIERAECEAGTSAETAPLPRTAQRAGRAAVRGMTPSLRRGRLRPARGARSNTSTTRRPFEYFHDEAPE